MAKVEIDAKGLRILRGRAVNLYAFADVACEWADAAEARILELEALFPQLRQAALIDDWQTFDALITKAARGATEGVKDEQG